VEPFRFHVNCIHFRGAVFVHVGWGSAQLCTENGVSFYMCSSVEVAWLAQNIRHSNQGRIKGGATGAIVPGPHDEIYLFQIKYSFEKFRDSEEEQEYNAILYSYVALSIKGSEQQLDSLQD